MPAACIDIGSNTTRLLVAELVGDDLRELHAVRVFTKLGTDYGWRAGAISEQKVDEVAEVVAAQVAAARSLGAQAVRVVATAAVRRAANAGDLCAAVRSASGVEVEVLGELEEARLGFLGATRTFGEEIEGAVAVVDVGGGSTEIAVGTTAGGVSWARSFAIGSGYVADEFLASDPPSAGQLEAARAAIARELGAAELPGVQTGIAIGGSASSLRQIVGGVVDRESLRRAVQITTAGPARSVAARLNLEHERLRVLPAGVLILEAVAERVGAELQVGRGGLREGVVLELLGIEGAPAS